jgi:hypothetical protein
LHQKTEQNAIITIQQHYYKFKTKTIMKKIFTLIVMLCATVGMQAQDTWTVAGEKAIAGVSWDPSLTDNDMTSTDGTNFTLTKTGMMITANEGGYGYKVVKNHAWGEEYPTDNALLPITEDAEYTIVFSFNADSKEVSAVATKTGDYVAPVVGEQTWTVAGAVALCGTSWDTSNTDNDMTSADGVNYTLTKEGLVLEADVAYGFKIVADHAWDEAYPADNYELKVTENGTYTVVFKFNKDTKEVGAEATKTGDAVIGDKVWTIAGEAGLMGGNGWEPENTDNDMTNMGDGTFQLVKYNVAMEAEKDYEFKVLANHSWDENYGADGVAGGNNVTVSVETAGNYDVTFVWNPESKELYATTEVANPAAISTVKTNNTVSVIYNLQGQRVQNNYRGIVVKNGRKMFVK